jgi:DNA-binding transcriptional regulator YhcF (GntR family)
VICVSDNRHTSEDPFAATGNELELDSFVPAYLQLAAVLRWQITTQQLPSGTPAPSEPDLAERYGVSRDTARRCYAILRHYGLIVSRRGKGHFVGEVEPLQYIHPAEGSTVTGRHVHYGEIVPGFSPLARALLVPILVVQEPGKPAARYDAMRTILSCGGRTG